jgi:hypothetical protein
MSCKFTSEFLERRLLEHREWQESELERLCAEVTCFTFDDYMPPETEAILEGLGR